MAILVQRNWHLISVWHQLEWLITLSYFTSHKATVLAIVIDKTDVSWFSTGIMVIANYN